MVLVAEGHEVQRFFVRKSGISDSHVPQFDGGLTADQQTPTRHLNRLSGDAPAVPRRC